MRGISACALNTPGELELRNSRETSCSPRRRATAPCRPQRADHFGPEDLPCSHLESRVYADHRNSPASTATSGAITLGQGQRYSPGKEKDMTLCVHPIKSTCTVSKRRHYHCDKAERLVPHMPLKQSDHSDKEEESYHLPSLKKLQSKILDNYKIRFSLKLRGIIYVQKLE